MRDYVGAILAAGRGKRMGTLGTQYPKTLLPVANEPLIVHHLRTFRGLGINEVYIVIDNKDEQIANTLGDGSQYGVRIIYIEQESHLGSAHALEQLAPFLNSSFVLLLGDYYFSAPDLVRMLERAKLSECSIMAAKREPNRRALCEACVLEVNEEGSIFRIVEKPRVPASNLKGCGIYVFRPEIFDAIRRTPRTALRDEYELTTSIELYIQAGYTIYAEEVIDWDMNFTCPDDVLQCNLIWLEYQGLTELIGENVYLADGTRLQQAIIGDNVIAEEPSMLRNVVVFQGVRIKGGGQVEQSLVTPNGLIQCINEHNTLHSQISSRLKRKEVITE